MLFKIIHFFVLMCYLNVLVYQPDTVKTAQYGDSLIDGDSLVKTLLEDMLDLPVDEGALNLEIRYDKYRSLEDQAVVPMVFILVLAVLFAFDLFARYVKCPVYSGKRRRIVPGYYTFLHRFQPF